MNAPKVITCIFCDNPANSREHVWPNWLKHLVPRELPSRTHYHSITEWNDEISALEHTSFNTNTQAGDPHSQRLKIVCTCCNNGWMSRLQEAVKPILEPLITGTFEPLAAKDQEILIRWATMFTMVVEYKDQATVTSSKEERKTLAGGSSVQGWHVSVARFSGVKWIGAFNHIARMMVMSDELADIAPIHRPRVKMEFNSQTTTFVIGKALFHVASCSLPDAQDGYAEEHDEFAIKNKLTKLNGGSSIPAQWSRSFDDDEANDLSNGFLVAPEMLATLRKPT